MRRGRRFGAYCHSNYSESGGLKGAGRGHPSDDIMFSCGLLLEEDESGSRKKKIDLDERPSPKEV
jgi:hypothetical protein